MICLVRHAETNFNKEGKIQGRSNNNDLNEKGLMQVKKLRGKISLIDFDICYSSPLLRTMETAFSLVGDRVLIERDDRLLERNMGEFEGKDKALYDSDKYWDYNLNCTDFGVEGVRELFDRCREFLSYIKDKHANSNILIVSHAAVIRALHFLLINEDLENNKLTFKVDNCFFEMFD